MVQKSLKPTYTVINTKAQVRTRTAPKLLREMPGGLYPIRMALWQTDDYRMQNGWPVAVPPCDIRARSLVSGSGDVLADRDDIRGLRTGAVARWVADDELFDATSLSWIPVHTSVDLALDTAADYAPTLITDYEYSVDGEVFSVEALNFDADSYEHMWCNLNQALGGASGYSMIMVTSLNSVFGNSDNPYAGLWCPGKPTPAPGQPLDDAVEGGWVSLTLQGDGLYLETDQSRRARAISITGLLAQTAPMMIALVVGRPYTTIYVASGPSSIRSARLNVGSEPVALAGNVLVGRSPGDILHTADMALMDLNLYGGLLTADEVKEEFTLLSSVYGGDR